MSSGRCSTAMRGVSGSAGCSFASSMIVPNSALSVRSARTGSTTRTSETPPCGASMVALSSRRGGADLRARQMNCSGPARLRYSCGSTPTARSPGAIAVTNCSAWSMAMGRGAMSESCSPASRSACGHGARREPAQMGFVEQPLLLIAEGAGEQPRHEGPVLDIGHAHENGALGREMPGVFRQQRPGVHEVLQHVAIDDAVDPVRHAERHRGLFHIAAERFRDPLPRVADRVLVDVDAEHPAVRVAPQVIRTQRSLRAADIEDGLGGERNFFEQLGIGEIGIRRMGGVQGGFILVLVDAGRLRGWAGQCRNRQSRRRAWPWGRTRCAGQRRHCRASSPSASPGPGRGTRSIR